MKKERPHHCRQWYKISAQHRKEEPYCRMCLFIWDRPEAAQCVDHIVPFHGRDDPLFTKKSNLQSLCHWHHDLKTDHEKRGRVVYWDPGTTLVVLGGNRHQRQKFMKRYPNRICYDMCDPVTAYNMARTLRAKFVDVSEKPTPFGAFIPEDEELIIQD